MITAVFARDKGRITGVRVSGHAGYAAAGQDIVCAAVTSAVQLTANGITEVLNIPLVVSVEEDIVSYKIQSKKDAEGSKSFFEALFLHLQLLAQEYPKHIVITETEEQ